MIRWEDWRRWVINQWMSQYSAPPAWHIPFSRDGLWHCLQPLALHTWPSSSPGTSFPSPWSWWNVRIGRTEAIRLRYERNKADILICPGPETEKPGLKYRWYFGNPAVSVRPCRLSAPSSRMVEYYRYHLILNCRQTTQQKLPTVNHCEQQNGYTCCWHTVYIILNILSIK